ncbi:MAG: aminotransferase class V-fold PLP-dependent enzyme [Bacteriovoracales bacterium]
MKKFEIKTIRKDFPQLEELVRGRPLVYLDNAASTLKVKSVIDSIHQHFSKEVANVHRGVHFLSEQGTVKYEKSRENVAKFLNAKFPHEIIFTKGTTEAINLVASSFGTMILKPGDKILLSTMEHHSNIVPWQMICEKTGAKLVVIPINDKGEILLEEYKKLLDEKVKIVSIAYISNSLGTINPIKEMIRLAHAVGAKFMVDAAQAVAHKKVDVADLDCDFLAFSSHKIFGPTGLGVLYGKEELLKAMPPYQGGGDMIETVTFEKTTYNELPFKFEAGTPPIAEVIALNEAIDYVQKIGFENIGKYEHDLLVYAIEELKTVPGIKLIGTAQNKSTVISFNLEGIHPSDVGTILDQQGIAVRTGHHCTQPVMRRFGIEGTVRASFSIYNTKEEVDALVAALKKVKDFF